MIRQYEPTGSRGRYTPTPRGTMLTGAVPVGTICQPEILGGKVIVTGWLPRDYAAWDGKTRTMSTKRIRGGHLATVRRLRDGKTCTIAGQYLLDADT